MSEALSYLMVYAGANGSGKSTFTSKFASVGLYINADLIQKHRGCLPLEAANIAEQTREWCLDHNKDFTFESVLSTPRNLDLIARARAKGYYIMAIYVVTKDANINVARVRQRVKNGGHDVPEEKIRARWARAMALIPRLVAECNKILIYDNSKERVEGQPDVLFFKEGQEVWTRPSPVWSQAEIDSLLRGEYVPKSN